jgi:PAS domain S-box-containing protein
MEGSFTGQPAASPQRRIEVALMAALLFALTLLAFGSAVDAVHWPALYLAPVPLLLWAAVRLGVGGTCVSLLAFAAGAIVEALRHVGPFAAQSPIEGVASLQAFLVATSVPLLLLAAIMDERRRTADLLRQSEARLQVDASSTDTGLWQWDERMQHLWLTQNCRTMFGLTDEAALTPYAFLDAVHPEDRARTAAAIESALIREGVGSPGEFRLCSEGETRWFILCTRTDFDHAGKPARVSGVFRDVSDRVGAEREADQLRQRLLCLRDDERRRIAEELHESTAQHLFAANLILSNLNARVPAELNDLVEEALRSVREATTEIRTFSYLLHPPRLGDEGLRNVLRRYVPGFERRTGVATSLRVTPIANEIPSDQQHAILRIVQESLGNVHRHAKATKVSVNVRCSWGNLHVVIRDNGEGIGAEEGRRLGERLRLGVGIPAIAARARQRSGRIDVDASACGTTIHVAIPLGHAVRAEAGEGAEGARGALAGAGAISSEMASSGDSDIAANQ